MIYDSFDPPAVTGTFTEPTGRLQKELGDSIKIITNGDPLQAQ